MLIASALGCSTVTPPAPPASATPGGDYPTPTIVPTPSDPADGVDARGPRDRPPVPTAPDLPGAYRFVSAPDFLNQDVAEPTAAGSTSYAARAGRSPTPRTRSTTPRWTT